MSVRSLWLFSLVLWGASLGSVRASAEEVCTRAYVDTQRLQRAAQFRAARREAVACGQDACSETVRSQCTEWLESIERAMPTLVIDARDGSGAAVASVRVDANGELLAERLNGRALELDPGEYVLRFSHGDQLIEQHTLIREAEKYRTLVVRFRGSEPPAALAGEGPPVAAPVPAGLIPAVAAPAPVSAPTPRGVSRPEALSSSAAPVQSTRASIPSMSYVLGGLGVASLTTFVALASSGYAAERDLRETCAGSCESSRVDAVRTRYFVADIALGVGVSSLVAAAAVWLSMPAASVSERISVTPNGVAVGGEF